MLRHLLHQAHVMTLTLNVKVLRLRGLKYKARTLKVSYSVVYTDIQDLKLWRAERRNNTKLRFFNTK